MAGVCVCPLQPLSSESPLQRWVPGPSPGYSAPTEHPGPESEGGALPGVHGACGARGASGTRGPPLRPPLRSLRGSPEVQQALAAQRLLWRTAKGSTAGSGRGAASAPALVLLLAHVRVEPLGFRAEEEPQPSAGAGVGCVVHQGRWEQDPRGGGAGLGASACFPPPWASRCSHSSRLVFFTVRIQVLYLFLVLSITSAIKYLGSQSRCRRTFGYSTAERI